MTYAREGGTYVFQGDYVERFVQEFRPSKETSVIPMDGQVVKVVEVDREGLVARITSLDNIDLGAVGTKNLYKIPDTYRFDERNGYPNQLVS